MQIACHSTKKIVQEGASSFHIYKRCLHDRSFKSSKDKYNTKSSPSEISLSVSAGNFTLFECNLKVDKFNERNLPR